MKSWMKTGYILLSIIFLIYLLLPNTSFPIKLNDALQSNEPADSETPLRRAYFTNYNRRDVLKHYTNEFNLLSFIPNYRLNYPPEEAQMLIRDQTRSTYLEEIIIPFRESFFVNGFEPKTEKDTIIINNLHWEQKIIVKHVTSNIFLRILVGVVTVILVWQLYKQWMSVLVQIRFTIKTKL
jgi:hypothetical protein